jgi:hypothetical protein
LRGIFFVARRRRGVFFVLVCRSTPNKFQPQPVLQNTSCSAVNRRIYNSRLVFSGRFYSSAFDILINIF